MGQLILKGIYCVKVLTKNPYDENNLEYYKSRVKLGTKKSGNVY